MLNAIFGLAAEQELFRTPVCFKSRLGDQFPITALTDRSTKIA